MIKDWFSNDYFDPFESEWENRPGKYKVDPNYMSMTLDDFIAENKLGDDKNFKTYAAKHHIVPWSDGYDTKKLDQLLLTYKNILDYEAKRDAKAATESDSSSTGSDMKDYLTKDYLTKALKLLNTAGMSQNDMLIDSLARELYRADNEPSFNGPSLVEADSYADLMTKNNLTEPMIKAFINGHWKRYKDGIVVNVPEKSGIEGSPTGIYNPADYLPAMRVGNAYEKQTVYEDIDNDGDVDKIEIEEKA